MGIAKPAHHSAWSPGQTLLPEGGACQHGVLQNTKLEALLATMPGSPGQGLNHPQSPDTSISVHTGYSWDQEDKQHLYPDSKTTMNALVLSGKDTLLSLWMEETQAHKISVSPPISSCQRSYFEDPAVAFSFTFFSLTFSCALRAESPERQALVGVLNPRPWRPKRELGEGNFSSQNSGPDLRLSEDNPWNASLHWQSTECHV